MKVNRIVIVILALFPNFVISGRSQNDFVSGKVISVEDGRTLTLISEGKKIQVQLQGIGTPTQALKKEATENLKKLALEKSVIVRIQSEMTKDKAPIIAKAVLDEKDIALLQLKEGFAWYRYWDALPRDAAEKDRYAQEERQARLAKVGIWSDGYKECKDAKIKTDTNIEEKLAGKRDQKLKVVGTAIVEMKISPDGIVKFARALCGHPILQTQAVELAYQWKFKGTGTEIIGPMTFTFTLD